MAGFRDPAVAGARFRESQTKKIILTVLIALLGFLTSVAWASPEPVDGHTTALRPASGQRAAQGMDGASRAVAAPQKRAPNQAPSARRVPRYKLDLPAGGWVICACVQDKRLG